MGFIIFIALILMLYCMSYNSNNDTTNTTSTTNNSGTANTKYNNTSDKTEEYLVYSKLNDDVTLSYYYDKYCESIRYGTEMYTGIMDWAEKHKDYIAEHENKSVIEIENEIRKFKDKHTTITTHKETTSQKDNVYCVGNRQAYYSLKNYGTKSMNVMICGTVFQVLGNRNIIVKINADSWGNDGQLVYVENVWQMVNEEQFITIYGTYEGIHTYITVNNCENSIPKLKAYKVGVGFFGGLFT